MKINYIQLSVSIDKPENKNPVELYELVLKDTISYLSKTTGMVANVGNTNIEFDCESDGQLTFLITLAIEKND